MSDLEDFEQDEEPFVPAPLGPIGPDATEEQMREQQEWVCEYSAAIELHEEWQKRRAERKRILQETIERQLAGDGLAFEWTEWHSPTEWQRIWHCSARKYRYLRSQLESEDAVKLHPKSGHKQVQFLIAALKTTGLATPSGREPA